MTDEEIEKQLRDLLGILDNKYGNKGTIKTLASAIDYIDRLKAENVELATKLAVAETDRENLFRTLEESNEVVEQAKADMAREILNGEIKGLLQFYVHTQTKENFYKHICKKYGVEVDDE